jgi:hypothetical protein
MESPMFRRMLLVPVLVTLCGCGGKSFDVDQGSSDTGAIDASTDAVTDTATDSSTDVASDTSPDVHDVRDDILAEAPDTGPTFGACGGPGSCVLESNGCCPKCGTPVLSDYTPVDRTESDAFRKFTCIDPAPTCPKCASFRDPNLWAFCKAKKCVGIDVRTDPVSACSTDADCKLRYSGCCECDGAGLIALASSKVSEYVAQVCDPKAVCDAYLPAYPIDKTAKCDLATKHCVVKDVPDGGV